MAAALSRLPVWRLTYSDLDNAVAVLQAAFARWPDVADVQAPPARFRLAELDARPPAAAAGAALSQRQGVIVRTIGEGLFLSDPEGRAIHRMDPLAAAIWDLLETPATAEEIVSLLSEAFPDADPARMGRDVAALLSGMAAAGLIG